MISMLTSWHVWHLNDCMIVYKLFQKKKKKDFTSFCQPTRLITCANYGNHVQYVMSMCLCVYEQRGPHTP